MSLRELALLYPAPACLHWLGDNAASRGRNPDMVNEYTPDEFSVRMEWVTNGIGTDDNLNAEFDRWLAGVKADAWDEGAEAGAEHVTSGHPGDLSNPYEEGRHVDQ